MGGYENKDHPLFWTWKNYCKDGGKHIVAEWMDFHAFCVGVGQKPSERHRLTRPVAGRRLGPDNFIWKEKVLSYSDGKEKRPPLYESWCHFKRIGALSSEWASSFAAFRDALGAHPGKGYVISRKNVHSPLGPDNWEWRKLLERTEEKVNRAAYMREYMAANPEKRKAASLKQQFGMSLEEYNRIGEKQGWVCAICAKPETKVIRGKRISLAVDHCHSTWRNRGLLCADCNRGLGHFRDEPQALRAAAEYLERHR